MEKLAPGKCVDVTLQGASVLDGSVLLMMFIKGLR